jgi:hypothetical protein
MRLLANEIFPKVSIRKLREAGYDVESVTELMVSAPDTRVLKYGAANSQVILTFDRDYGKLIFHRKIAIPKGLVYLKFDPATPRSPFNLLICYLKAKLKYLAGLLCLNGMPFGNESYRVVFKPMRFTVLLKKTRAGTFLFD